jgi:hypothetical protein
VQRQGAVVCFLWNSVGAWHRRFPELHRRAQWHIGVQLCTRGRDGAAIGELSGLVKQLFLLDDATVRERISEMAGRGLCVLDPADAAMSARTIVLATESLLHQFDAYLHDVAAALRDCVLGLDPASRGAVPALLDPELRQILLQALECGRSQVSAALDQVFNQAGLSPGRRLDAQRRLLSTSHGALLLLVLEHRYTRTADPAGLLADDLAAALLALVRQNFQTTRDHIGSLIQLGLLERRPGRVLRVALPDPAGQLFDRALGEAAHELPRIARLLPADPERTGSLREPLALPPAPSPHVLLIRGPGEPPREVHIGPEPILVGRAAGSGIPLSAIEVSRTHCRIALAHGQVTATDLNSTNGTLLDGTRISGTATLAADSVLQIGPYHLEYRQRGPLDPDATKRSAAARQRQGDTPA